MERRLLLEKLMVSQQPQYLTFSSINSFTLNVVDYTKYWDGTLEYSTDKTNWSTWDGTTTLSSASDGTKHNLYLRGTGNTYITGSSAGSAGSYQKAYWVLTGSGISCKGNIENLLDYATVALGNHPVMANNCYAYMFKGCDNLVTAPELPATTLSVGCYKSMFSECRLRIAPSLPATSLTEYCYSAMFAACFALVAAPELPATTLANYCYREMFSGCPLRIAPSLPATTLSNGCYLGMFKECENITTAPTLPATTLATDCYEFMFDGCVSLTTAPELPATTLANYCYWGMFRNCFALTTAPELPATTLKDHCYREMFKGCINLTTIPGLPATTLTYSCYNNMFNGCTKIKLSETQTGDYQTLYRIPTTGTGTAEYNSLTDMFANTGGTFTGTPTINTTYYTSNTIIIVIPQLSAPVISLSDDTLSIEEVENAEYYDIYVDGVLEESVPAVEPTISVDITGIGNTGGDEIEISYGTYDPLTYDYTKEQVLATYNNGEFPTSVVSFQNIPKNKAVCISCDIKQSPYAGFSNLVNCQGFGDTFDYYLYDFTGNASATMTFDED